jgi:hypothetical protein
MILESSGSTEPPPSEEAIRDEERRARRLRLVVDITCSVLMQAQLTRAEAEDIVATARRCALELFPDKEETFDLILAPRFERLMTEFIGPRRILPFKPRPR